MKSTCSGMLRTLFCFFILVAAQIATGQNITIKGAIFDKTNGESLVGVYVYDSLDNHTVTGPNGDFTLVTAANLEVFFSFTGYEMISRQFKENSSGIEVQLAPKSSLLNQVVISAGLFEQELGTVTASMERISPELIANTHANNLIPVLDRTPGVDIIDGQTNIRGGSGYSYGSASRVSVLIDDLPILTGDAGYVSWSTLPMENIGQIEVIKGASSVLYGSSALSGVIHLRTKKPTPKAETSFRMMTGMYMNPRENETDRVNNIRYNISNDDTISIDTQFVTKSWWDGEQPYFTGLFFHHAHKKNNLSYAIGGNLLGEKSYLQGKHERRSRVNLNTRYDFRKVKGLSAGINANYIYEKFGTFFLWGGDSSDAYLPLPGTSSHNYGSKMTVDPHVTWLTDHSAHKLRFRYYKNYNSTNANQDRFSDLYYGKYIYQRKLPHLGLNITMGGFTSKALATAQIYGDTTYSSSQAGGFTQIDRRFWGKLQVSGGFRYEWNKIDTATEAKPVFRIGANYEAAKATFIRGSFGQGYRFPTIAEKFISTSVSILGIFPNPNLTSETGWNAEIGIKQGYEIRQFQGFADFAIFHSEYQDMMEFTYNQLPNGDYGFQSVNIGATKISGFETSIAGTGDVGPFDTDFTIGYTYIHPRYAVFDSAAKFSTSDSSINILKYRYKHTAKWATEWRYKHYGLQVAGRYYSAIKAVDRVFDVFIPGVKDYRDNNPSGNFVWDVSWYVQINEELKISIASRNILNNEYSFRPGLMEAPRSLGITMDWKM